MKLRTMLIALAAACALTACEDLLEEDSLKPDGSNPSVTVNNPSNNQALKASQGLRINITAVDKDKFKDIDFTVKGANAEKALLSFKKFPARNVLEFDTVMSLNGAAPGNYTLLINATDKRTNLTLQEVKFTVK